MQIVKIVMGYQNMYKKSTSIKMGYFCWSCQ